MQCDEKRDELQRRSMALIIQSMRQHHRIVEKRIDGIGIHHSQHRMLMQIGRMGKTASQKEIASMIDVSPACVARTLKSLSANGFIAKDEGAADGRCNEISLSPKGEQLVQESHDLFRQIDSEVFKGLSDEDLMILAGLMERIRGNMDAMEKKQAEKNIQKEV